MAYDPYQIDKFIVGAAAAALNMNILNSPASATAVDTSDFPSANVIVAGSAGITAGAIAFEGSNDGATWVTLPSFEEGIAAANWGVSAINIAASTVRQFAVRLVTKFFRVRISTAFVGGSVTASARLSQTEHQPRSNNVSGSVNASMTPVVSSLHVAYLTQTVANTTGVLVKGSAGALYEISISNNQATAFVVKLYNKATAPTVGTDLPLVMIPCPAGQLVNLDFGPFGKKFALGIGIGVTANNTVADTTAPPAGAIISASYV